MPSGLKLSNPEAVRALLATAPLGDVNGLDSEALGVELAPAQSFAGEALTASMRSGFSIRAFNSPDDEDDDGVIGRPDSRTPIEGLAPHLSVDASSAYLKYRGQVALKAAAGVTLRSLGFEFSGEAELVLTDYHRHPRQAPTRETVLADLAALRSSLRLADVEALMPGEAVAHQMAGRATATVELSWVDVVSGSTAALRDLLGPRGAFGLRCSSGATLSVTVSFADDFVVVISRADAALWRVGLRKARTRSLHVGLSLGVTVEIDPHHLQQLVDRTFEGMFGAAQPAVQKVLTRVNVEKLKDAERAIVDKVAERFGLDAAATTLPQLRERVDAFIAGLEHALALTIKAKVEAGFAYEYRRILETTTVFQCLVTRSGLARHHPALVKGAFAELLREATASQQDVRLEHFLYQRSVRAERSWGLTLSLGKWTIGSRDRKALSRVEQYSVGRALRRHAYLGERSYTEAGDKTPTWSVVFAADMPVFTAEPVPRVSDFELALSIVWHEDRSKLDEKTLARWVDHAVLWGAVDAHRQEDVLRHGREALKGRAACVIQVTVPPAAFDVLLAEAATHKTEALAPALAAAMPWTRDDAAGKSPAGRRRAYERLWQLYLLADGPASGRELAGQASDHLRTMGARALADRERLYALANQQTTSHDAFSFGGLVDLNPETRRQCHAFVQGLQRLQQKRVTGAPDAGVIAGSFEQLEDLWTQSLHVRAVGVFLIDAARAARVDHQVNRAFTLSMGSGEGWIFSGARG